MRSILFATLSLSLMSCANTPLVQPEKPYRCPIWHPGMPLCHPAIVTLPSVIELPSPETLAVLHPRNAGGADGPGYADLHCATRVDGSLGQCVITSEYPAEHGFGRAALNAAAHIRVVPATEDGAAIEGTIPLRIEFPEALFVRSPD